MEPTTSRQILSITCAASTSENTDLDQEIKQHAYVRIQLTYLIAMAYYKRACRTNGSISDFVVQIGKARIQVGQGDKENHGAHANAISGIRDNSKENMIKQIGVDNGLTPQKEIALRKRGISEIDLNTIRNHPQNTKKVKEVIEKVWQGNSILSGTEFEVLLNLTHVLPTKVNLCVDKYLEKHIRPDYIPDLIRNVAQGKFSPEQAAGMFTEKIQELFKEKIKEITDKIKNDDNSQQNLTKLQNSLKYFQLELEGSIEPEYSFLSKGFTKNNSNEIDVIATLSLLKPFVKEEEMELFGD